jgi:DNA-binding helix-hairpin-helix protein with protein kinase domain
MTSMQIYLDGKPIRLGKLIGKGGEGEVFQIEGASEHALKIYGVPDARRESKVTAMVRGGLASGSDLIAFPSSIARRQDGAFVGFTMRLVRNHTSLHELYSPGSRKIHFPKADYRFTIRAAANIARAVGKVHDLGAVIGDINHSGILISDQAVAALIDADSFQFGHDHLCRVGVAEYTPPELQGQSLDGVVRTANHDAFGLAVVIFQLLFMGRHPFMGRYAHGEMPIEKAIAEHRFAYSRRRKVGMTPPPGACVLADFPPFIGEAFEAAFEPGARSRPTAAQWAVLLRDLEASLSKCGANGMHFYPSAAGQCTWCRMEQQIGILLFLPAFDLGSTANISDPGAAGFNLAAVWAAIERVHIPEPSTIAPAISATSVEPSSEAKKASEQRTERKIVGFSAIALAVALLWGLPPLWFVYLPLAWFGFARAFGAATGNTGKFVTRFTGAETAWHAAVESWRRRIGLSEMSELRRSLSETKIKLQGLPAEEQRRIAEHNANRHDSQLHAYLEAFPIRRATIRGVGPAKLAALASYGIDTAADIVLGRIVSVPGFGESTALPLLQWRQRVASRFVFRAQMSAIELQEVQRIRQSSAAQASQMRTTLLKGASDLQRAALTLTARAKAPDPGINRAHADREQARQDLQLLGLPIPVVAIPSPAVVKPQPKRTAPGAPTGTRPPPSRASSPSATSCPTCGGRMVKRLAKKGRNAGGHFMGCAAYPRCRGTRSI